MIDALLDVARVTGQLREWMLEGLAKNHVSRDQVSTGVTFWAGPQRKMRHQ